MKVIILLISILLFFNSCTEKNELTSANDHGAQLEFKRSRVPDKISIQFAENFNIQSIKGGYKLELLDPNSHEVESTYELTFNHLKKGENVIHIPVENIAALSQTTVGMLSKLDALSSITGISKLDYVFSPEIKKRFALGEVTEFGDESNFPIEKMVKSKTQLIIYSGFGTKLDADGKLRKLGIQSLPNYEWRETHPLGRAEWIKLFGILIDKPNESIAVFNRIKTNYEDLRWKMRDLQTAPTVISGNLYSDQWMTPAGNSYNAILIQDAGGQYVYRTTSGTGSIFLPIEKVVADNRTTACWINPGVSSKDALAEMNPKAKFIGAYNKGIYCYSHQMNKYWEMGAIEPDFLLEDLIHIFHPEFEPGSALHFYQAIAN